MNPTPKIYINGKFFDKADAKISVFDHGLLYGDGIFEGLRIYESRVFRLRRIWIDSTTAPKPSSSRSLCRSSR